VKLLRLSLNNFKGIKSFTLEPQGEDVNIYGDNAVGKTTIFDAFTWLLFGKDSLNRADFEIKTLGPDGEPEHGLEHTVEAILELEDGSQLALKKVYQEKWTKKRGSATAEFTGHTTDYFIDGVPVQKKEYDARIVEIADENIFRLLTDPRYFNEVLHWQKRRELLLEVCGDISDAEVIASQKNLSALKDILGNRTIEQHRKVIQARKSEINKQLEKIPVRIDEVERGLPDTAGLSKPQLETEAAGLKEAIRSKEQQISRIEEGGEVAEKTKRLREIEAELFKIQNGYQAGQGKKIQEVQKRLYDAKSKRSEITLTIENAEKMLDYNTRTIGDLEEKAAAKRQQWYEANAEQFAYEQDDTCPTCGQKLPAERLQEAREKALADFNLRKAKRLEEITGEGKKLKARISELDKDVQEKQDKLEGARKSLAAIDREVEAAASELEQINQSLNEYMNDPAYQEKLQEKEAVEAAIRELKEGRTQEIIGIRGEIESLREQLRGAESKIANLDRREQGQKRIEELKAQERELAAEYERLEQELYLTEQFIRSKVQLLEEKINSKFQMARFKLFNVLINGGVEECCETLYQGVPYNSALNNAARINVGLDIINTLSEHYGFEAPIWIDNREAVTRLIPVRAQVISLIVSEQDKTLRVEIAEKKVKEAV
jgi:DNA repair exonuclease SbcCD ATPase subunit